MEIKGLKLKDFRNYESLDLQFKPGINIIYGKNGQGKTNIIEALYFLSTGRSHRTNISNEMIKYKKNLFSVGIEILDEEDDKKTILYSFEKNKNKEIYINGMKIEKISELIGNFIAILFSPESLSVVKGSPAERRRFIDIFISQISSTYLYDLQRYMRIIKNKNKLLKEIHFKDSLKETLFVWNEALVETGIRLVKKRNDIISSLSMYVEGIQKALTYDREIIKLEYKPSVKLECSDDKKMMEDYRDLLYHNMQKEIECMTAMYGPHRDDMDIEMNGINVRQYCSQGQQRSLVLSMKMAKLKMIEDYTGKKPVLLLDDIMSELDNDRKKAMLVMLKDIQTFITTTDDNFFKEVYNGECTYYEVENGKVSV